MAASRARAHRLKPIGGIIEVCAAVRRRGTVLGILTGKDRPRTMEVLSQLNISNLFEVIGTSSDGFAPKPSEEGVHWVCERLASEPKSTIFVGDSVYDMQAGKSAGCLTVGCGWGVAKESQLRAAGADLTVLRMDDLADLLGIESEDERSRQGDNWGPLNREA